MVSVNGRFALVSTLASICASKCCSGWLTSLISFFLWELRLYAAVLAEGSVPGCQKTGSKGRGLQASHNSSCFWSKRGIKKGPLFHSDKRCSRSKWTKTNVKPESTAELGSGFLDSQCYQSQKQRHCSLDSIAGLAPLQNPQLTNDRSGFSACVQAVVGTRASRF